MGTNVYGSPITKMTVEVMPEYEGKEVTRFDVAKVGLDMINAENKLERARAYLNELKSKFGDGVCTKGLIYNATGETITFVRAYDWLGHVGESAYPVEIHNGQWGVFFHQKPPVLPSGSEGAVVYRLKNLDQRADVDCMMSWSTPWGPWNSNHCYAEIREKGHFDDTVWGVVERKMINDSSHVCVEKDGQLEAKLTIGESTTAEWTAVVKLV